LMDIVKSVGLPVDQAREIVDEKTYKIAVDDDWKKSHEYGVTGVPTFVSQGFGLVGAQPYENLEQFVQGVIDKATELKNEK
jgi:predicted DsbA family dithiol-disulfide isomerase